MVDGSEKKKRTIWKQRRARSFEELDQTPWDDWSGVQLLKQSHIEDFFFEFELWKSVKPWLITVVATSWENDTGLFEIIANAAVNRTV